MSAERDLLQRAYEVIRCGEVRLDAECSGESPLAKELRAALAAREEPAKTHEYEMPESVTVELLTATLYEKLHVHEYLTPLDAKWADAGAGVKSSFRAIVKSVFAAREDEVERLREGLERALDVSFIVGLLRMRAGKTDDAELAEWGERLKGQLVAIREVLSPGTAVAMAELRDTEAHA